MRIIKKEHFMDMPHKCYYPNVNLCEKKLCSITVTCLNCYAFPMNRMELSMIDCEIHKTELS